jgi:hypothetical protein
MLTLHTEKGVLQCCIARRSRDWTPSIACKTKDGFTDTAEFGIGSGALWMAHGRVPFFREVSKLAMSH